MLIQRRIRDKENIEVLMCDICLELSLWSSIQHNTGYCFLEALQRYCNIWRSVLLLFVLIVGLSSCSRHYSYREKEDIPWIDLLYYNISFNVPRSRDNIDVAIHRQKKDGITHIDSTVNVELYFYKRGDLVLKEINEYDVRLYSLEGVDAWQTDAPLHAYVRYQVDSIGILLTKECTLTLKKYGRWGSFSVHQ